ncbi:T9SS type A sorting domain-containing protein [bacterium]|nr:T9SS type A sorting domain-containing protein [bacterium]
MALPVVTEVYSDSLGGTVGIKVYDPIGGGRHFALSPVIINLPGGWDAGGFSAPNLKLVENGMVYITFLMPGITFEGVSTEGVYDLRGKNCLFALKEVIRFAAGKIADTEGDYITDLFPGVVVDTSNVGMTMVSNGGNMGVVALSMFGPETGGLVDYMVGKENPTSPQTCLPDLGFHESFLEIDGDGNGFPNDDYKNPWYIAYGDTQSEIDLSRIAYDPTAETDEFGTNVPWAVFLDGNGNGLYDETSVGELTTPDLNGNGIIDTTEDFIFTCLQGSNGLYYYSVPVTNALYLELGSGAWPDSIATPDSAEAFWFLRSAVYHYDSMAFYSPSLAIMQVFSEDDHVQVSPDKVHIHNAYNGFRRNNLWARLNPDRAYIQEYFPSIIEYPDNPANIAPLNWLNINAWAEPETTNGQAGTVAGILEMADRTFFNVWEDRNLERVLLIRPPGLPPIYVSLVSHNEEPPGDPDYAASPIAFLDNRSELLNFADMLHEYNLRLNWQTDWNFARAVALFDTGEGTCGLNIVQYMKDSLQFEIDPHAHESRFNYADVAHFIEGLGVMPSRIAGGFIAWPYENSVYDNFLFPIIADSFPGYSWTSLALWGAATSLHIDEDTLWVSGIWKPAERYDFFTHNDAAPLPHIGGYRSTWTGVRDLLNKSISGLLESGKIYTATVFIAQQALSTEYTNTFKETLNDLQEFSQTGWLQFRTLGEMLDIWRDEYDSIPNLYWFSSATGAPGPLPLMPDKINITCYPNPFNYSTVIKLEYGDLFKPGILHGSKVLIKIYNLNGKVVYEYLDAYRSSTLQYSFIWSPDPALPSGVYLIRASIKDIQINNKLVFLK